MATASIRVTLVLIMISLLIFLAVLSVLVLIHELGHFFAARLMGVKADEFGYGFPPRLIAFVREAGKWKRVRSKEGGTYSSTIWSLNWLPLGGFVRLKGEEQKDHDADSFLSKGFFARFFILIAGVFMNWILAAIIFSTAFCIGVPMELQGLPANAVIQDARVQIVDVVKDLGAAQAGIKIGDVLLGVNGERFTRVEQAQTLLGQASLQKTATLLVRRDTQEMSFDVTPALLPSLGRPGVGLALADIGVVHFSFFRAIYHGVSMTWTYTKLIILGLVGFIRDLAVTHKVTADLSGPVGIAVLTGTIAQQGWWSLMQFMAVLSLNLAVINFLPIPALDGGRIFFLLIESIRRKRASFRVEGLIHQIGFFLLLALILVVTVHDLRQYGGVIWHGFKTMIGLS